MNLFTSSYSGFFTHFINSKTDVITTRVRNLREPLCRQTACYRSAADPGFPIWEGANLKGG